MRLVILESPYAGDIERNTIYARAALADCLKRGEAPLASHLLYTQPHVLRDNVPEERRKGIAAGLAWYAVAQCCVVYMDYGDTPGMLTGIETARRHDVPVEYRFLTAKQPMPWCENCQSYHGPAVKCIERVS